MEGIALRQKAVTVDVSKIRRFLQGLGVLSKTYAILSLCTCLLFVFVGLAGYAQSKTHSTPTSSIRGLAASVSYAFFLDMMGLEVPHLVAGARKSTFSQQNVFSFMFRLITDINPQDPRTLLAREVPGLGNETAFLLRRGKGTNLAASPEDYLPPKGITEDKLAPSSTQSSDQIVPTPLPTTTPQPNTSAITTNGKKVVMIYHSHNRESWVPELGIQDPAKAFDEKTNITLVGKRLAQKLEDRGIGAVDYSTDYPKKVSGFNYNYSYKYSANTVREAFAANPDIQFVFDIHRDSSIRSKTTITIDGVDYPQVLFIIGQRNPQWKANEKFANQVHEKLELKKPGISRGIWGKSAHDGNAEYNQSYSSNNILVEIGGPYNTLEECYRTADLLADVIAELYWDAEKVNAPAPVVSPATVVVRK